MIAKANSIRSVVLLKFEWQSQIPPTPNPQISTSMTCVHQTVNPILLPPICGPRSRCIPRCPEGAQGLGPACKGRRTRTRRGDGADRTLVSNATLNFDSLFHITRGVFAECSGETAQCPLSLKSQEKQKKNSIPDSRKSLYLQAQFALDLIDAADKAMSKDQVDGAGPASHEGVASPVHAHLQKLGVGHK